MSRHLILTSECFNSANDTWRHKIWHLLFSLYDAIGAKMEKCIKTLKIAHGPMADGWNSAIIVSIGRVRIFMCFSISNFLKVAVLLDIRTGPSKNSYGRVLIGIPLLEEKALSNKMQNKLF